MDGLPSSPSAGPCVAQVSGRDFIDGGGSFGETFGAKSSAAEGEEELTWEGEEPLEVAGFLAASCREEVKTKAPMPLLSLPALMVRPQVRVARGAPGATGATRAMRATGETGATTGPSEAVLGLLALLASGD